MATGSTTAKEKKSTDIRLYIITRYPLQAIPDGFKPVFLGRIDFDLADQFVTAIEGTLTNSQMQEDIYIEIAKTY